MKPILLFSFALALLACSGNENDFDATGTFESTEIIVSSEANGKIMELNLQEGDRLEAGAVLGYVDSTQLYLRKKQLEAGLRSVDIRKPDIRKQIASLEQQIAVARSEQQRMENLVKAKAGNQKQVDDIVNNIKVLQKQLDAQYSTLHKTTGGADAEAESIVYQIMQLDDQLQKSRIVNPKSGTVLMKYAEPGEVTAAGKPLYKIADTDLLYLRAYPTAEQLTKLKIGGGGACLLLISVKRNKENIPVRSPGFPKSRNLPRKVSRPKTNAPILSMLSRSRSRTTVT